MNTIEIVLEKVTNETIDVIEKLESVRSVEKADTDKDIKLIIKYLEDADISGNILNSLSGLKILSFNQKELTLEDVYIKLVEASR